MSRVPQRLLPDSAEIAPSGSLSIGGLDVHDLVDRFGTPLFVYDEHHLRARAREAVKAFPGGVAYATKAFICGAMVRLAVEEGMDLDVSTGGEIQVALASGAPAGRLIFHGNNKSKGELQMALDAGVKRIVVDSSVEMDTIESLVASGAKPPQVSIRVNPGVEAHTHEFLQTGIVDSKFGIPVAGGEAARAIERARQSPAMSLVGLHAHVGSQVFDVDSFRRAMLVLGEFLGGWDVEELSIGGGLGVAYVDGEYAPSITGPPRKPASRRA